MDERISVVNLFGPGSQPSEDDGTMLQYPIMPSEMSTYRAPDVPPLDGFAGAQAALGWLDRALQDCVTSGATALADITSLDADNRTLINQVLGEGEVSARRHGEPAARSQESVLAGVWRTFYLDAAGAVVRDLLEVGAQPHFLPLVEVVPAATVASTPAPANPNIINAPAIVTELIDQSEKYQQGDEPHVLNLTLLPMADEDTEYLDAALGFGQVDALSRSYGRCHIQSTRLANVWWVRYFNSMQKLILNTIEVVDMPAVVRAAPEDLQDSLTRLRELLEPYEQELGRA